MTSDARSVAGMTQVYETQAERTDLPLVVMPSVLDSMVEPIRSQFPQLHDIARVRMFEEFTSDEDVIASRLRDADVLLVNKRAGISVEADERGGVTLTELAARHVRQQAPDARAPKACHRLDNQTCGLLMFAKTEKAEGILERAFRDRTMDKRYICLVRGMMKPPKATCRAYLLKDAKAAHVTIHDSAVPGARPIVTAYETLEQGAVSRVEIHLITGRTHQIRAHMAALGHPLLGDDVYGDRAFNRQMKMQGKLCLCAAQLTLDTGGALPQLDGRTFRVKCPF